MRNTEKKQEVKQKLPNEIGDLFLLNYDYDVEYEVFVEDGCSIGSRNINFPDDITGYFMEPMAANSVLGGGAFGSW
jgi:hypothetical protein